MGISYKKLWKLLIDLDMNKSSLCKLTGISSSCMAKLSKNENVNTNVLARICFALQCNISDIMETLPDDISPKHHSTHPKYFVDLFAGCGGLSLGLEQAGFTPVLVNELNDDAMATYLANRVDEFPWLIHNKISDVKDLVLSRKILDHFRESIKKDVGIDIYNGELDLLCGGPPCQGFSGLGIRRSYSVEKEQLPSNYLYQDMAFLVNKLRPKIFLFENVKGLMSSKWTKDGHKGEIFEDVLHTFQSISGYNVCYKLVHAKDYGVPQNRPRILIVGLRDDIFHTSPTGCDAVKNGFLPPQSVDILIYKMSLEIWLTQNM